MTTAACRITWHFVMFNHNVQGAFDVTNHQNGFDEIFYSIFIVKLESEICMLLFTSSKILIPAEFITYRK